MVLPTKAVKRLPKNGTIWPNKHTFVWHIIYKQYVVSVNVRIHRKEKIKVLMKNWLVRFI